jgi:hypothetical protein
MSRTFVALILNANMYHLLKSFMVLSDKRNVCLFLALTHVRKGVAVG